MTDGWAEESNVKPDGSADVWLGRWQVRRSFLSTRPGSPVKWILWSMGGVFGGGKGVGEVGR